MMILADDDCQVTFNYRLSALGWLSVDSEEVQGNQGLHDMVAALSWVQDNVANFGGDPDQVTSVIILLSLYLSLGHHLRRVSGKLGRQLPLSVSPSQGQGERKFPDFTHGDIFRVCSAEPYCRVAHGPTPTGDCCLWTRLSGLVSTGQPSSTALEPLTPRGWSVSRYQMSRVSI